MRRFCKKLTCSVCQFRINDSLKGQKEMLTHIETDHMENLLGFRCNNCDVCLNILSVLINTFILLITTASIYSKMVHFSWNKYLYIWSILWYSGIFSHVPLWCRHGILGKPASIAWGRIISDCLRIFGIQ